MNIYKITVSLIYLIFSSCGKENPNLELNRLFSDGMVLQRNSTVPIWGNAMAGENVNVKASWGIDHFTTADSNGLWKIFIETQKEGGPFNIEVGSAEEKIVISDVYLGEVWLAAGQSNMEMNFSYCCNTTDSSENELNNADYSNIRMFNVKKNYLLNPTDQIEGSWIKAEKDQIKDFSAVAYFFAKNIHNKLNIPLGIIHSSWGGSDIESWISKKSLNNLEQKGMVFNWEQKQMDEYQQSINWFSNFPSIKLPSGGFDLMLGTYTHKIDPTIQYNSFFLDKWRKLNLNDSQYAQTLNNFKDWKKISFPNNLKRIFPNDDFQGVIILKKSFEISDLSSNYVFKIDESSLGWAGEMREYDIYINGIKIWSTFGDDSNQTYHDKLGKNFKEKYKSYPFQLSLLQEFSKSLFKKGENEIGIRVYGAGEIGTMYLENDKQIINLNEDWHYRISAEEFRQTGNYSYPYLNYYLYDNDNIDFSKRPKLSSFGFSTPRSIFNGMVNPLVPYAIKGVLWYQGENNAFRHQEYESLFRTLILDWRNLWGEEFPFYYVQIAPYFNYYNTNALLREAQRKILDIPKTGMVVTLDIGEHYDIHPSNKHDVGYRLAQLALKNEYGFPIVATGPMYDSIKIKDDKAYIFFKPLESGLVLKNVKKTQFEIAGNDKKYYSARASVIKDYIQVSSSQVKKPQFVRYAWSDTASATLFNEEGFPASSFSSE